MKRYTLILSLCFLLVPLAIGFVSDKQDDLLSKIAYGFGYLIALKWPFIIYVLGIVAVILYCKYKGLK